jgi:chromosome partitioning protein
MKTIAIYSPKGGVGKTTLAVNLGWCSSQLSSRQTLVWELDPQGAAAFLLRCAPDQRQRAQALFDYSVAPDSLICNTPFAALDLLPADRSLDALDGFLRALDRRKRLAKLTASLRTRYDRVILDCPPVLNEVSDQVFRAVDVLIIPLSPSPLARRALDDVRGHLARTFKKHPPILPVFTMVDRRRALHRAALEQQPDWPVIPMASQMEQVAVRRAPLGSFDRTSSAAKAVTALWSGIERKLVETPDAL